MRLQHFVSVSAMLEKLRSVSALLRGSLRFLPSVMTAASIPLAFATTWADGRVSAKTAMSLRFVFGVVFSITVVALQLASTQYSPRHARGVSGLAGAC
jgi:uncharacterized membrane protein